jgi:hypothetical protein
MHGPGAIQVKRLDWHFHLRPAWPGSEQFNPCMTGKLIVLAKKIDCLLHLTLPFKHVGSTPEVIYVRFFQRERIVEIFGSIRLGTAFIADHSRSG